MSSRVPTKLWSLISMDKTTVSCNWTPIHSLEIMSDISMGSMIYSQVTRGDLHFSTHNQATHHYCYSTDLTVCPSVFFFCLNATFRIIFSKQLRMRTYEKDHPLDHSSPSSLPFLPSWIHSLLILFFISISPRRLSQTNKFLRLYRNSFFQSSCSSPASSQRIPFRCISFRQTTIIWTLSKVW